MKVLENVKDKYTLKKMLSRPISTSEDASLLKHIKNGEKYGIFAECITNTIVYSIS